MTVKERKNIVASVLARLRGTSKSSGAPFQQAPSAACHGAIPVSHLKVEACAKCHSEGRAATEDNRHPETLDVEADGLMFLAGGSKARFTLPARLQRVPLRSAVFWHR